MSIYDDICEDWSRTHLLRRMSRLRRTQWSVGRYTTGIGSYIKTIKNKYQIGLRNQLNMKTPRAAKTPVKRSYSTRSQQKPTSRLYDLVNRRDLDGALARLKTNPLDVHWSAGTAKCNIWHHTHAEKHRFFRGSVKELKNGKPTLLNLCIFAGENERNHRKHLGDSSMNSPEVMEWTEFALNIAQRAPRMIFGLDDYCASQFKLCLNCRSILLNTYSLSFFSIGQWTELIRIAQSFYENNASILQILSTILPHDVGYGVLQYVNNPLMVTDNIGNTPLHILMASHDICCNMRGVQGYMNLVRLFLQNGSASLYVMNQEGKTPLHTLFSHFDRKYWTLNSFKDFMSIFPRHALKVSDKDGMTILHIAAGNPKISVEFVRFLAESEPSSLLVKDINGNMPLQSALQNREAVALMRNARIMFGRVGIHIEFMNQIFDSEVLNDVVTYLREAQNALRKQRTKNGHRVSGSFTF